MAPFEGEAKYSAQVHIGAITRQCVDLNVESPFSNTYKDAPCGRELSRIPYKKTLILFRKDKVIRKCVAHYLKKNVRTKLV